MSTAELSIDIDVGGNYDSKLTELSGRIRNVKRQAEEIEEIDVDVSTRGDTRAIAEMDRVAARAHQLDDIDATVDIDVDDGGIADSNVSVDSTVSDGGSPDGGSVVTGRTQSIIENIAERRRESAGDFSSTLSPRVGDDGGFTIETPGVNAGSSGSPTTLSGRLADRIDSALELDIDSDDMLADGTSYSDIVSKRGPSASEAFEYNNLELSDVFRSEEDFIDLINPSSSTDMGSLRDQGRLREGPMDSMGRFNRSMQRMDLNMSQLYTAFARLLPLIFTFVGALPAAITALGTLAAAGLAAAGALAAVTGLGFLGLAAQRGGGGDMKSIQQGFKGIFEELRQSFLENFLPLADRFDDLARDAIGGIKELFRAIAARGQLLVQLKDDARALGGFLLEVIPDALGTLVQLADAFAPIFAMFGQWAVGADLVDAFISVTREALPVLMNMAASLMEMAPLLMSMSVGFLQAAGFLVALVGAIFRVITGILEFIGVLGPVGRMIGLVIGLMTIMISVTLTLSAAYSWLSNSIIATALTALKGLIVSLYSTIAASYGATVAVVTLTAAFIGLLGILTFGLAPILGSISSSFLGTSAAIDRATSSLKNFQSMKGGMGGVGLNSASEGVGRNAMTQVNQTTNNVTFKGGSNSNQSTARQANKARFVLGSR